MHFDMGSLSEVAIVALIFVPPAVLVALIFFFRHLQRIEREKTIRLAIEKGEKLPPEVLQAMETKREHDSPLASGVFFGCLFIGIGCITEFHEHGVIFFFCFMGLGFILRAIIASRKKSDEPKT